MMPFAAAFPWLFHVTRRTALAGIRQHGLLAAATLLARHGDPGQADANRATWTPVAATNGAAAWLRWQRLSDHGLLKRLPATITPQQWRAFINGMVFLSASSAEAERLMSAPADAQVEQVMLRCSTGQLLQAGCELRLCRWNNGFLDRSKPPRQRGFADYTLAGDWRKGDAVREITVVGGIPASVPFEVVGRRG